MFQDTRAVFDTLLFGFYGSDNIDFRSYFFKRLAARALSGLRLLAVASLYKPDKARLLVY